MIIVVTRCCLAMRSDRQGYLKRMRYAVLIKLSLGAFLLMAGCALFLECGKTGALQYNDASFDALQSVREAREAELTAYFEKLARAHHYCCLRHPVHQPVQNQARG